MSKDAGNDGSRFIALNATAISSDSQMIEGAAYGDASIKLANYTLGVDYTGGDVVYACEIEGSITDKTLYPNLLENMQANSFDLSKTVLAADCGSERLQTLIDEDLPYVCAVSLTEKSVRDKFSEYWMSLNSCAYYDDENSIYVRTDAEEGTQALPAGGSENKKYWIHYYRDPELAQLQTKHMLKSIEKALKAKAEGSEVDPQTWKEVERFIGFDEKTGWFKRIEDIDRASRLCGCFAIRTNCLSDPFKTLEIYKQRDIVESGFRVFKVLNDDRQPYCCSTHVGRLFIFTLAETIRLAQIAEMKKNAKLTSIERPDDSMDAVMMILGRLKAVKGTRSQAWKIQEVSQKDGDALALLGVAKLPKFLH